MSAVPPISPISSNSPTSVLIEAIAELQAQLSIYAQAASGPNALARTDYQSAQAAITSGDLSLAQLAIARLQQDSKPDNSSLIESPTSSPVQNEGQLQGSQGVTESPAGNSLDTTA